MLGPYAVQFSTDDPRPAGTAVTGTSWPLQIGFDRSAVVLGIGQGWTSWSHDFIGDVYYTPGTELVVAPPPLTVALGVTIQPNLVGPFDFDVTANGVTTHLKIDGNGGAQFVGFWSDSVAEPIRYLRIWDVQGAAEGFAIAELTVFAVPEPAMCALFLGLVAAAWVVCLRRRGRPSTAYPTGPNRDLPARNP